MTFEEMLAASTRDRQEQQNVGIDEEERGLVNKPSLTFEEMSNQLKEQRVQETAARSPAVQKFLQGPTQPVQETVTPEEQGDLEGVPTQQQPEEPQTLGERFDSTVQNVASTVTPYLEDLGHKVRLGTESAVLATADLYDFVRKVENFRKTTKVPGFGGQWGNFELPNEPAGFDNSYRNNLEKIVESAYSAAGYEGGLAELQDGTDIPFKLAGEFASGTGILGAARKGWVAAGRAQAERALPTGSNFIGPRVENADELSAVISRMNRDAGARNASTTFYGTEATLAVAGTGVGSIFGGLAEGTLDERYNQALLGSIVGVFTPALWQASPLVNLGKKIFKNANNPVLDESVYKMSVNAVMKHLKGFISEEDVPRVTRRMQQVRAIQNITDTASDGTVTYPFADFNPTVGHIVGTPEIVSLQRVFDTKNYQTARQRFQKTSEAAERLAERYRTTTDLDEKALLANVVSDWHNSIADHLDTISVTIRNLEDQASVVLRNPRTATDLGEDTRTQIQRLQEDYRATRNMLAEQIDPEGLTVFDAKSLINSVKETTLDIDLENALSPTDAGYVYLTQTLPKYISGIMKTGDSLPSNSLMNTTPTATIGFRDLEYIHRQLGNKAASISRADPSSNAPNIMNVLRQNIKEVLETKMLSGDPEVAKRYEKFRSFMSNEYYPRFKEGVGGELLERVGTGNAFAVRADEVMPLIWKKGDKETTLEEFKSLFTINLGDTVDPALVDDVVDIARGNLRHHAYKTLQDSLNARGDKSPLDVFETWKRDYRGAINSFTDISEDVSQLERTYAAMDLDKTTHLDIVRDLHNTTLSRYLSSFKPGDKIDPEDIDVDKLISGIFTGTNKEAGDIMADILTSAADADGRRTAFTYQMQVDGTFRTVDRSGGELGRVDRALKDLMFDRLFVANMTKVGDAWLPNADNMDQMFNKNLEKFRMTHSDSEIDRIQDIIDIFKTVSKQTRPVRSLELDELRQAFQKVGITPASVLSRYYSASLGKVGPLYLFADAMTRLATGLSKAHFDRAYTEILYDLDGLERVLNHTGAFREGDQIRSLKAYVQETGIPLIRDQIRSGIFSQTVARILYTGQNLEFVEEGATELQQMFEEERPDDQQSLTEWFLLNNDLYTGQPSRIAGSLLGDDPDTIESRLENVELPTAEDNLRALAEDNDRGLLAEDRREVVSQKLDQVLPTLEDGKTYIMDPITGELTEEPEEEKPTND